MLWGTGGQGLFRLNTAELSWHCRGAPAQSICTDQSHFPEAALGSLSPYPSSNLNTDELSAGLRVSQSQEELLHGQNPSPSMTNYPTLHAPNQTPARGVQPAGCPCAHTGSREALQPAREALQPQHSSSCHAFQQL